MTDTSLNATPLLSSLPSPPKYTAESLVSLIREGHSAKLSLAGGQVAGAQSNATAQKSSGGSPGDGGGGGLNKDGDANGGFNEKDLSGRSPVGCNGGYSAPIGSASTSSQARSSGSPARGVSNCQQASPVRSPDSQQEVLSSQQQQRQKCTQQQPISAASVSMYLTSSDLRNLHNFRILAERDGLKLFAAASAVANPSPGNERPSNVKVLNSPSIPVLTGTAFTIKNENQLEHFDDHGTVNSTATTTEDEDDQSLSSLGRVSRHDQEESNKASLSISGLSGKFLIPAQLQFASDSPGIGLTTSSSAAAAAFSSLTQSNSGNSNQQAHNHFSKSSSTSTGSSRVLTSNSSATLLCNSDGQLIVPADQINILKAFGELHGYKIQAASGGQGLVLSASNQEQSNSSGNVTLPLIKNQSQIPNFTSLLPMHQLAQDAARKREMRLQKNREAARECRRKKKEYIRCLENRVAVLENQNKSLLDDLRQLRELYCQSAAAQSQQPGNGENGMSQQSQPPPRPPN